MRSEKEIKLKLKELRREWASIGCGERRILNKKIKILEWCLNLESNETYLVKPRHTYQIKCLFCGNVFKSKSKRAKFCCGSCRVRSYKK